MNVFKMKQSEMKDPEMDDVALKQTIAKIGWTLERDEDGRLFHAGMREMFNPLKVDLTAVEALAAVRFAGRSVHLLQERWADAHGLSEGRMAVLFRLFRCGDLPLGDIADALDYTPRNITGLVDHLERDGLVERVPDPTDRRSIKARLTDAGRERIESIWKEGLQHQSEIVKGMSKEELAQLRHLCLLLVENARKELGK
jgi:DNA-binding MarR family transcriptional regulator